MAPDVAASSARSRTRLSSLGIRDDAPFEPQDASLSLAAIGEKKKERKKRGRPRKIRPSAEVRDEFEGDEDSTATVLTGGGPTADAPSFASSNADPPHGMDVDVIPVDPSLLEAQALSHAVGEAKEDEDEDMVQPAGSNITQTEPYLSLFMDHLASTRAHLLGSSQAQEQPPFGDADTPDIAWTSSTRPWTRAELDAFFHALTVHSRWRPDLIADDITRAARAELSAGFGAAGAGGKSIAQVIELLDVMEHASAELAAREAFGSSASATGGRGTRYAHEPAVEASDGWIGVEERMALEVVRMEEERDAEAASAFLQEANPDRRKRRCEWEDARAGKRRKSEVAGGLGALPPFGNGHLQVLDSILRAAEGLRGEGDDEGPTEDPQGASQPKEAEQADEEVQQAVVRPSNQDSGPSVHGPLAQDDETSTHVQAVITDEMIDPALLGEEHTQAPPRPPPTPPTTALAPSPTPSAPPSPLRAQIPPLSPSMSSAAQPSPPAPPAVSTVGDPDEDGDDVDPAMLSPTSRRRYQKRLYMRRKRASGSGSVNTSVSRLKPGRKKSSHNVAQEASRPSGRPKTKGKEREKRRTPASSVSRPVTPVGDGEEGAVGGESEQRLDSTKSKSKGRGLTTPYKLRAAFANAGVDAAWLQENGMDLFNLGSLGRLSGLMSSLEGEEDIATDAISPELVRFLQAVVTAYVGDVAREAIVLREQERKVKERSKVWKFQEHSIPSSTIKEALQLVGVRYMDKKAVFNSMMQRGEPSQAEEHEDGGDVEDEEEVGSENSDDEDDVCGRDLRMSVFYPPPSFGLSSFACLAPSLHEDRLRKFIKRESPPSTSSFPSPVQGVLQLPSAYTTAYAVPPSRAFGWEDDVMASDTDEEALQGELDSEEAVNAEDEDTAREHEKRLREAVGLIGDG